MASLVWFGDVWEDLRFGCRRLTREPWSAAAIILVLSCGIGLSVAIFSTANTVLRRPLSIDDQDRVVVLWGQARESIRTMPLTPQHFERFRREARALEEVAGTVGIDSWPQPVRDRDDSFRINLAPVTGNFFRVLGTRVLLGRTLTPEDDQPGAAPGAVISSSLWRGRFAGDPRVLGRRLELRNGKIVTVVGVAPPGLEYPTGTEMWVPFAATWVPEVTPIGRLARTATPADAAQELGASFQLEPAGEWRGLHAAAVPLPSLIVGNVRQALLLLCTGAAVLLVTACLNVGNLLLLRGTARQRELSVRRALGAGPGRIVRLLVAETIPLTLLAGAAGTWISTVLLQLLVALAPASIPRLEEVRLQGIPLGMAILVSGLVALAAGLLPSLSLSGHDAEVLRGSRGGTSSSGTAVTQRTLVVAQMALAVLVLFIAGLLGRTLQSLYAIDTGLDTNHVVVVELTWPDWKFTNQTVAALYERLLPRLKALPGVTSAAAVNVVPFTGATGGWDGRFVVEGKESISPVLNLAVVGSEYFETMGIALRSGRAFDAADRQGSALVAILSEGAARLLSDDRNIIGRRIRFGDRPGEWRTIVGVAPDTRYRAIRDGAPTIYIPMAQFAEVTSLMATVTVHTTGPVGFASIRDAVAHADPDVAVFHAATLSDLVAEQFSGPRLNAVLLALFAAGAVLLAVVGLYAVLAGAVRARRRELAIRQAVGAAPARLRRMVLGQAAGLCTAGLTLGLLGALATGRLLDALLYGVSPTDLQTVWGVVILLAIVSIAAGYLPALQASRPDLTTLLREE